MNDKATQNNPFFESSLGWLRSNDIRNEKGDAIEFDNHPFLEDIYLDDSQYLTIMKAAQVGLSTCAILKNHNDAKNKKLDIIYTLPTDQDVSVFVGGKVNRIIGNNPPMIKDVADKDSIEQKQVGNSMIYFRGTWTKKAAIMVTADRLVHDEKDSSSWTSSRTTKPVYSIRSSSRFIHSATRACRKRASTPTGSRATKSIGS